MNRIAILNIVGLTKNLIGENTPRIQDYLEQCDVSNFSPAFPAVTCTAQATYLTGKTPSEHGIVGNGWYDRDYAEPVFWKQSNHLIKGDKIWDEIRKKNPALKVANLFWWYNMYSGVDYSCTPRPIYRADGKKIFDVHTQPMQLRDQLKEDLGDFPFPSFWGPMAGIASSRWIAKSAMWVEKNKQPDLNFIYLPHLDYCLQQHGTKSEKTARELRAIDALVGELLDFFKNRKINVLLLSEYGISDVDTPIHLNREFRKQGWLEIKDEQGHERLECGQSKVFAIADHQVAHIYLLDPSLKTKVKTLLENHPDIEEVRENTWTGIGEKRGGDFVAVAKPNAWFTYYFWQDDAKAPDYARSIDIHRKIGYDPAELFIDPCIKFPKLKMGYFLLKKKCGFRATMKIIPLDAKLVKGSHGRDNVPIGEQPLFAAPKHLNLAPIIKAEQVNVAIQSALEKNGE